MRSTLVGAFAIVAGLAIVATSAAVVSRAHAQEATAAVFFGFLSPDKNETIPLTVRATVSDVTCGTANVTAVGEGLGFYLITVVSANEKAGCGVEGTPVTFLLLAGEIDPGSPAAQTQAWTVGTQRLDLSAVPDAAFGAFVGELPMGPGLGMMRWSGASATPIEEAVGTIARQVKSVSHFDVPSQSFRSYIPGAPAIVSDYLLVDRDDIIVVRVR
jgi:hypothetical protein